VLSQGRSPSEAAQNFATEVTQLRSELSTLKAKHRQVSHLKKKVGKSRSASLISPLTEVALTELSSKVSRLNESMEEVLSDGWNLSVWRKSSWNRSTKLRY
jgi:hypothetical protein